MLRNLLAVVFIAFLCLPALAQTKVSILALERIQSDSMLFEEVQGRMGQQSVEGVISAYGATGDSMIAYKLGGKYEMFSAWIGYLNSASTGRKCTFQVIADGVTLLDSEAFTAGQEPDLIKVPVKGKQLLILRIVPKSYGSTQGAAFGSPFVYNGVRPEDLVQSLQVDINGKREVVPMSGGRVPHEIPVLLPIMPGTSEYRVKIFQDPGKNRVQITTEKVSP